MKARQNLVTYDTTAPKKAANLSINSDLLEQAKALNINLSRTLEQGLEQHILAEKRKRWQEENREAIDAYNKRVEEYGVFSDGARSF
jgi:antitoxin CcdA